MEIEGLLLSLQVLSWDYRSWLLFSVNRNASQKNFQGHSQHVKYIILVFLTFHVLQTFHLIRPTINSSQIWERLMFHHLAKVYLLYSLTFYTSSFFSVSIHLLPTSTPIFLMNIYEYKIGPFLIRQVIYLQFCTQRRT